MYDITYGVKFADFPIIRSASERSQSLGLTLLSRDEQGRPLANLSVDAIGNVAIKIC